MSPFQFILSGEDFANKCNELFSSAALRPTWEEAFEQCENYRDHLQSLPILARLKTKSYLLRREDVEELLRQNPGLNGIRIYIGHEVFPDGSRAVRLFTVACTKMPDGRYNDWNIPDRSNLTTTTILGESRPCPDECGDENDLNRTRP